MGSCRFPRAITGRLRTKLRRALRNAALLIRGGRWPGLRAQQAERVSRRSATAHARAVPSQVGS